MIPLFFIFLIFSFSTSFSQESASETCNGWLKVEETINKRLPEKIDDATELTGFFVNCDTETVKYAKRILVDVRLFKEGWMVRKQRQHTLLHCNQKGISSTEKWNVMDVFYDKDFKYLVTFNTSPKDCN